MVEKGGVKLKLENSILKDIREGIGLGVDASAFDTEILMYINALISEINQNGVGSFITVDSEDTTWGDLIDPTQVEGNKHFQLVPLFIMMSTKLFFDPPPPSTAENYSRNVDKLLWRLKIAYETRGETDAGTI